MTITAGAPVVVGVDGSAAALDAVRVAVREAEYRQRPLRVVHAFIWPLTGAPLTPVPGAPVTAGLRNQAEQYVTEAVEQARKIAPDLRITGVVVDGAPTPVLVEEARGAVLTVLGHRGLGGFAGLLLGSVTVQVAARAQSPVMVVRGEARADGPVVVGVDGSELSTKAVAFAFEEADRRDASLVAVHAWLFPTPVGPGDILPLVYDLDAAEGEEERTLAESIAGFADRYPQVPVRHRVVRGSPGRVLVEASKRAQLVVVGAHGRGAFGGLLLGSVSHAVLHHGHSPLVIVRHGDG
ncbi:universal stress protein [Salinispora arenicola]|uniref:universal stress protein n=1 Tax=Salinispora arenicola TaxID=168697 RepID=UPI00040919A2|nr:universal stress protein [Salinispora arenicola]MCN0180576.1 universal stress protein [Salinispora arenicola]NIL59870.1 universal stress protein [Salinispora arenicola]NIL61213.1 universal stress protein [Salinispora arenicola]